MAEDKGEKKSDYKDTNAEGNADPSKKVVKNVFARSLRSHPTNTTCRG